MATDMTNFCYENYFNYKALTRSHQPLFVIVNFELLTLIFNLDLANVRQRLTGPVALPAPKRLCVYVF